MISALVQTAFRIVGDTFAAATDEFVMPGAWLVAIVAVNAVQPYRERLGSRVSNGEEKRLKDL